MSNVHLHGRSPYAVAVLHGGPGAAGEAAPVARELSSAQGVLEPLQTAKTVEGQVAELRTVLEEHGLAPLILVGYSWGAWLGLLLAARQPRMVKKLILVSSGPFEEKFVPQIQETRFHRLRKEEKKEVEFLMAHLDKPGALSRLSSIFSMTDVYDPLPFMEETVDLRPEIYKSVWAEATELRKSGKLLEAAARLRCPVVAIHGDHDPHPAAGVQKPLSDTLKDFKFILLENCGHVPWIEKQARDEFFHVLNGELK